ncbi:YggT family protein [Lutibacter sp. B2]|nr:YggT family protein [Lutibacter sp. B2]
MWIMKESIDYFFRVLNFLIIARIVLSWLSQNTYSTVNRIVYQLTEPILLPFRNLLLKIGLGGGMIDFSPILAVLALDVIRNFIYSML